MLRGLSTRAPLRPLGRPSSARHPKALSVFYHGHSTAIGASPGLRARAARVTLGLPMGELEQPESPAGGEVPVAQAGAVPFRVREDGRLEVLIITATSGGWSIPKGLIDPGFTPEQAALAECEEEAGAIGTIAGPPLGTFDYEKWGRRLRVTVYPMRVERVLDQWLEQRVRERRWASVEEAVEAVKRPGVAPLIAALPPWLARAGGGTA